MVLSIYSYHTSFLELLLLITTPFPPLWVIFSCFFVCLVIFDGMLDIINFTLLFFWDAAKLLGIITWNDPFQSWFLNIFRWDQNSLIDSCYQAIRFWICYLSSCMLGGLFLLSGSNKNYSRSCMKPRERSAFSFW